MKKIFTLVLAVVLCMVMLLSQFGIVAYGTQSTDVSEIVRETTATKEENSVLPKSNEDQNNMVNNESTSDDPAKEIAAPLENIPMVLLSENTVLQVKDITICFDLNYDGVKEKISDQIVTEEAIVSAPSISRSDVNGNGYQFLGWSEVKNGGDPTVYWDFNKSVKENGANQNGNTTHITLFAQWKQIDSFATGTKDKPYPLKTMEEFTELAKRVNGGAVDGYSNCYFISTVDVFLNPSDTWIPIGTKTHPFKGIFDGDGLCISGMKLNADQDYQGFFGAVEGGSISNIEVNGIHSAINIIGKDYVGAIVGFAKDSSILNCYNKTSDVSGNSYVGGIIGHADGTAVSSCFNMGTIVGKADHVGGIAGLLSNKIIDTCYNKGAIKSQGSKVGGIVGSNVGSAQEKNCFSFAAVAGTGSTGAICGDGFDSNNNCFYSSDKVHTPADAAHASGKPDTSFSTGEIAYLLDKGGTQARTKNWTATQNSTGFASKSNKSVYKVNFDMTTIGAVRMGKDVIVFDGAETFAYLCESSSFNFNVSAKAGALITTVAAFKEGATPEGEKILEDRGTICLEEGGRSYSFHKFEVPASDVTVRAESVKKTADQFDITFNANGGKMVDTNPLGETKVAPVKAGYDFNSTIDRSQFAAERTGDKDAFYYTFDDWYNEPDCKTAYDPTQVIAAPVTLYAKWIPTTTITVKFDSNALYPDEVVGNTSDQVINIQMDKIVSVDAPNWPNDEIETHEFLGWSKSKAGENTKPYWDFDTTLITQNMELVNKTDASLTLYGQWKVTDAFETGTKEKPFEIAAAMTLKKLARNVNAGKPYADCYFKLTQKIDLSSYPNWIPIGSKAGTNAATPFSGHFDGDCYPVEGLTIMGTSEYRGLFGYMSGGSLKNLKVTGTISAGRCSAGIVGSIVNGTTIEKCVMQGTIVASDDYIGGIVGYAVAGEKDTSIQDCTNQADITNSGAVGGILGGGTGGRATISSLNKIILKNCENIGNITAGGIAGGIVASLGDYRASIVTDITSCTNKGNITAEDCAAGIVAELYLSDLVSGKKIISTITLCQNAGEVSGKSAVGGIVGEHNQGVLCVSACKNAGSITSNSCTGGILGCSRAAWFCIEKCNNTAPIKLTKENVSYVGGIAGKLAAYSSISDCHNTSGGTLDSGDYAPGNYTGGLFGQIGGNTQGLDNCSNEADIISSGDYVGGIVGKLTSCFQDGTPVKHIRNAGNVTSPSTSKNSYIGGLFGYVGYAYQRIQFCHNDGAVASSGGAIGGITGYLDKYTQLSHCYNTGDIHFTATQVNGVGGLVGINKDAQTSYEKYCYNYGKIATSASINVGSIAGTNTVKIRKCYYLSDEENNIGGRTAKQFENGEVAFELDNAASPIRTYYWAQATKYPIFSNAVEQVYKYAINTVSEGSVASTSSFLYANSGANIILNIHPNEGYVLKALKILGDDGVLYPSSIQGNTTSFVMPQTNVSITPEFICHAPIDDQRTYTVDFITYSGTIISQQVISEGKTATIPMDPIKEGFVFKGWYSDAKYAALYNFSEAVFENTKIYAKWIDVAVDTVTVDFNLNGSIGEVPAPQYVKLGDFVMEPVLPVWESGNNIEAYFFEGWYTRKNGGSRWNFAADPAKKDMTLYAHWTVKDKFATGTKSRPYVFNDAATLAIFAEGVIEGRSYAHCYFELGKDMTITEDWKGIGYVKVSSKNNVTELTEAGTVPFKGHFDGANHTITLHRDQTCSLFGALGSDGIVERLNIVGTLNDSSERKLFGGIVSANFGTVQNCDVVLDSVSTKGNVSTGSGGVVGVNPGLVQNCTVRVELYHNGKSGGGGIGSIGGIAGYINYGKIYDCMTKAGTYIKNKNQTGGIAGTMTSNVNHSGESSQIIGCTVERGVTVEGEDYVGGIAGYTALVRDCKVGATIIGKGKYTGGISAYMQDVGGGAAIENCYWYGDKIEGKKGYWIGSTTKDIKNCYYGFVEDDGTKSTIEKSEDIPGTVMYKTTAQFNTGEVAYLLDGGASTTHSGIWTQDETLKLPALGAPTYYSFKGSTGKQKAANAYGTLILQGEHRSDQSVFEGSGSFVTVQAVPRATETIDQKVYAYGVKSLTVNGNPVENGAKIKLDQDSVALAEFEVTVTDEKPEKEPGTPGSGNGAGAGGTGQGSGTAGDQDGLGDGTGTAAGNQDATDFNDSTVPQGEMDAKEDTTVTTLAENKKEVPMVQQESHMQDIESVEVANAGGLEEGSTGDEDEKSITVFEIIQKTVEENPIVLLGIGAFVAMILLLAGYGRYRKNRVL